MKPPTATMPISPDPGSTRRPSSVNTALFSVIANLRRLLGRAGRRHRDARARRPPTSRTSRTAGPAACAAAGPACCRGSTSRRTTTIDGDARQVVAAGVGVEVLEHRPGERLADDHDVGGPAPLDRLEQLRRRRSWRSASETTAPPPVIAISAENCPVPCISGQATIITGGVVAGSRPRSATSVDVRRRRRCRAAGCRRAPSTLNRSSWRHITPFGMPVVPPV